MNDIDKALNLSLEQQGGTVIIGLIGSGNSRDTSKELEKVFCDPELGKEKDFFQTLQEINQSQEKPTALDEDTIDTIIFDLTKLESIYFEGLTAFLKAKRYKSVNKVILLNPSKNVEKTLKTKQLINPDKPKEGIFDIRTGTQQDILSSLQSQSE